MKKYLAIRPIGLIFVPVMASAEKTRQFIIEKAAFLINQKGMAGTSISDIMAATKLAKGGIYGNFENKEEICREAFAYLMKYLNESIARVLQGRTSYKEKLLALLDHYRELAVNEGGGCPMQNFGTESDDTDPAIQSMVADAVRFTQNRISQLIKDGIQAGEFKDTVNAKEMSIKMFALIEGGILTSRIFGNNQQMKLIINMLRSEIAAFSV
ncbi:DNA-binding transcriptional regulator, AcrR family [Chitinophaga niabensis]|uniref:DNA-binding transcriptional regulator, AcrR family n=2 Tax=Chitinophaga niabensis TaxID=536979 RepID=A0A1N6DZS7_9BACT|nr:DNA-binding transcriptional regulator, AcrR family [Chitinophaga niabensis]